MLNFKSLGLLISTKSGNGGSSSLAGNPLLVDFDVNTQFCDHLKLIQSLY